MAKLLEELTDWFVQNNVVQKVDVYHNFIPAEPYNLISLDEYDSTRSSIRQIRAGVRYVQIKVRNESEPEAYNKIYAIYHLIAGHDGDEEDDSIITLPSGRWVIMVPKQMPFKLSIDEHGLHTWCFNVAITTNSD